MLLNEILMDVVKLVCILFGSYLVYAIILSTIEITKDHIRKMKTTKKK